MRRATATWTQSLKVPCATLGTEVDDALEMAEQTDTAAKLLLHRTNEGRYSGTISEEVRFAR